jgi:hypothetical protein
MDVVSALFGCKLFVVLGTRNFGEKTDVAFSTYSELECAVDIKKPIFLIKTFDGDFSVKMTRFRLPVRVVGPQHGSFTRCHRGH